MEKRPFLYAAGACFPVGREMSLLVPAGSHHPPFPQESSAFRFNALCGFGWGSKGLSLRMSNGFLWIVVRDGKEILYAAGACFPVGRELSLLVPAGSRPPPIPQESSAFRFNALCGFGWGSKGLSLRMSNGFLWIVVRDGK